MSTKTIEYNSIELFTESFGSPDTPCVLLIMGASASMVWWDGAFCRRLADKGFFVIRYDNRDTGCSTTYEPGTTPYSVMDMAEDAVQVLAGYGIERAHLVGMSLGGMLAQIIALEHPEKVASLTLIASSVWADLPELPGISEKILQYHASAGNIDWNNEQETARYLAEGWRLLCGSRHPFDTEQAYALAATEIKRARNLLSMFNHAALAGGEALYGRVGEIEAPALIIRGTEDPVLPFEHALALQRLLKHGQLLTLEGGGHEIHRQDWNLILDALEGHLKGSGRGQAPEAK